MIYDSEWVSLEHLLLARYPPHLRTTSCKTRQICGQNLGQGSERTRSRRALSRNNGLCCTRGPVIWCLSVPLSLSLSLCPPSSTKPTAPCSPYDARHRSREGGSGLLIQGLGVLIQSLPLSLFTQNLLCKKCRIYVYLTQIYAHLTTIWSREGEERKEDGH